VTSSDHQAGLAGLTVADVVHARCGALPADCTVSDVRAWFARGSGRHLALIADEGRFVGSLLPEDVAGDVEASRTAAGLARTGPTVDPDTPATVGMRLALSAPEHRLPVVDRDGRLVGIVAITPDLRSFCGTDRSTGC
jgi:CBS-domain-containing membrane protein